jgi:biopolymer transport protein ExbD
VKPLSPRARVKIAAGLLVLATFAAIIMVLTGGGKGGHRLARTHDDDTIDLAAADQAAARAYPPGTQITIVVDETGYTIKAPDLVPPHYDRYSPDDMSNAFQMFSDALVKVRADAPPDAEIVIEADPSIAHAKVVEAMDAIKAAGFDRISLHMR